MAKTNKPDVLSPLGYGISYARLTDFSANVKSSSGVQRVIEAIVGRLVDNLWYDSSYGINLMERLRGSHIESYKSLEVEIERELLKDDRISDISVVIDVNSSDNISIHINGLTSTNESFGLVGNVNSIALSDISFV
jgi:hypothetical protein